MKRLLKAILPILFIIFIFGTALYKNYIITKLDYNDLTLVNEEFDHYTYKKGKYKIYTKSEEIYILTEITIEDEDLKSLSKGDILSIYVMENTNKIVEISVNNEVFITLDETIHRHNDNLNSLAIFFSIITILGAGISFFMAYYDKLHKVKINKDIKKVLKEQNYNDEEINQMLSDSKNSSLTKQELIAKFEEAFYYINNKLTTHFDRYVETDEDVDTFNKFIFNKLDNDILKVYYDADDEESIFVAYKINDKLFFDNIYKEENSNKYIIDLDENFFCYPEIISLSNNEKEKFINKIEQYNQTDNILVYKNTRNRKKREKLNPKSLNRVMLLGNLFSRWLILIGICLALVVSMLCDTYISLRPHKELFTLLSLALPIFVMGIDYTLGIIFKFDHIVVVYKKNQCHIHEPINYNDLSFDDVNKKEMLLSGIILIIISIVIFVLSFFN